VSLTHSHSLAVRIVLIITYIHGAGIAHSDYYRSSIPERAELLFFFLSAQNVRTGCGVRPTSRGSSHGG